MIVHHCTVVQVKTGRVVFISVLYSDTVTTWNQFVYNHVQKYIALINKFVAIPQKEQE